MLFSTESKIIWGHLTLRHLFNVFQDSQRSNTLDSIFISNTIKEKLSIEFKYYANVGSIDICIMEFRKITIEIVTLNKRVYALRGKHQSSEEFGML